MKKAKESWQQSANASGVTAKRQWQQSA